MSIQCEVTGLLARSMHHTDERLERFFTVWCSLHHAGIVLGQWLPERLSRPVGRGWKRRGVNLPVGLAPSG